MDFNKISNKNYNISFSANSVPNKEQNREIPHSRENDNADLNFQPNAYIGKSSIKTKNDNIEKFIINFLNEKDVVKSTQMLLSKYPELIWLTENVHATPEIQIGTKSSSISETLFGQKHVEFDRTIVGIECLKQVINNDYKGFTACQKENVKLTKENFKQLRDFTMGCLKTPKDVDALIAYTVINDLGKIASFTDNIESITGQKTKDHDEALIIALKTIPKEIPSFDRLTPKCKNDILNALNADFNLGQFVQAESLPGNLTKIKDVTNDAMDLYLAHMFYDVAGAAGHVASNGSLVMNNNVYKGYMQGINAIKENPIKSEKEIYNIFLKEKAKDLHMPFETKEDAAMVRLAVMSRAYNQNDLNLVYDAFNSLDMKTQDSLLQGLQKDGIEENGVLLYYAPAFIQNALTSNCEDKKEVLSKAFTIMGKLYENINPNSDEKIQIISLSNIATAIKTMPEKSVDELLEYL